MRKLVTWCFVLLAVGCGESGDAPTAVTAEDVAWAADLMIWKIDLAEQGPIYGVRMVVVDGEGKTLAESSRFDSDKPIPTDKPLIVMISAHRDGGSVAGKVSMRGTGSRYAFEDAFDPARWAWTRQPVRVGDLYPLAADSATVGIGTNAFEAGSTKLALELLTEPQS